MKKSTWLTGFFIAAFTISGCQTGVESPDEVKIPVEITKIKPGSITRTLDYHGEIKAEYEVRIFSKIADRIETFYVEEGDSVEQGEVIARILAQTIKHNVKQAQAGLMSLQTRQTNLKADLERTENLFKVNAVSKQQLDSVSSQYESITAQVEQAQAVLDVALSQLKDAAITSPISGIIGRKFLESGDMVMPSQPVATVVQMDNVKILFEAVETDLAVLQTGQHSEISVRSYPDRVFTGSVSKISPVLDPFTRMATIEISIPNEGHLLKPGMFARARITTGIIENIIVVPRFAVLESTTLRQVEGRETVSKNYFVYVVSEDNKAEQRSLEVRYMDHSHIAVESGLSVGEKLVISGHNNLRDGVTVIIAEPFRG